MAARLNRDAHLGKELARINTGQTAKITARCAVDTHWHNRCAGLGGDKGRAVVNLHQRAGAGNPPFRKNHHRLPAFDQPDDLLHRQRTRRIHRQMLDEAQHDGKQWPPGNLRMHHENSIHRHHQTDQQTIKEGLMVGDDQRALVDEGRRVAAELNAEKHFEECAQEDFQHDESLGEW